jgi:hypothetical protein
VVDSQLASMVGSSAGPAPTTAGSPPHAAAHDALLAMVLGRLSTIYRSGTSPILRRLSLYSTLEAFVIIRQLPQLGLPGGIVVILRDSGYECQRCYLATEQCSVCHGDGSVQWMFGDCTECDGTGRVCRTHGKFWKK